MKEGRRTAHRVGIAPMVLCIVGLTAWTLLGCSSPASPASTSSWTLSFDGNGSDGGEVPATKKYAAGALVVLPDAGTLTKTGLFFTGWNTKANGSGKDYPAGASWTMETSHVTFYAQWEGYPLTFGGNGSDGGEVPATKKYAAGALVVLPDAGTLTKTGLFFKGWNTKANGSGKDYPAGASWTMGTSPATFYAQWEMYTLTFDGNGSDGGEVPATKKYAAGATVVLPDAGTLTKTGLFFKDWNTKANGSGKDYPAGTSWTMETSHVTFYAQWAKGYAVSYDGNGSDGGEVPASRRYTQGVHMWLPYAETLTKTGLVLKGWNTEANGSGDFFPAGGLYVMWNIPVTFYAQWEKGYAVSYDGNGSDGGEVPATKKYIQGAVVFSLGAGTLTKTGLLFKSWNTKADGSGKDYFFGDDYTMGTTPITFYAQWAKGITLTYDGNGSDGGEVPATEVHAPGEFVAIPYDVTPTRTGLFFRCWDAKADGSGKDYYPGDHYTMGTTPSTIYAQWSDGYEIIFDGNGSDGGEVPATKKYAAGVVVWIPDAGTLTKTGFTFAGWNTEADGSGRTYRGIYKGKIFPTTFYAQWGKGYTLTFDGNGSDGGEVLAAKKYVAGAIVTLPGAGTLTRTDFTFTEWNTKANGEGKSYPANIDYRMESLPVTFYAQWTYNK